MPPLFFESSSLGASRSRDAMSALGRKRTLVEVGPSSAREIRKRVDFEAQERAATTPRAVPEKI